MTIKQNKLLILGVIVVALIGLPILKRYIVLPDILDYFFFEVPFFLLGRLANQIKRVKTFICNKWQLTVVFAFMSTIYLTKTIDLETLRFIRWAWMFFMRVSGISFVFFLASLVYKFSKSLSSVFLLFEREAFGIYLIHQPFFVSGLAGFLYALNVPRILLIILSTLFGVMVPVVINHFMRRFVWYRNFVLGGH